MEENTEVTLDPEINPEMVERILADIFSVSVNIVGDHLTDDEFADYVIEAVPADQVERLNVHLSTCEQCNDEMIRLLEISKAWRGQEGAIRLKGLGNRVRIQRKIGMLGDAIRDIFSQYSNSLQSKTTGLVVGMAESTFGTRAGWTWQSPDKSINATGTRIPYDGSIVIQIGCSDQDLLGVQLYFELGKWREQVTLQSDGKKLAATAVIPADIAEQVPDDARLISFDLIDKNLEGMD